MMTNEKIDLVQSRILERIVQQVRNGQQSKLFANGIYSCGQFLELKDKNQRGVHGSSAALRVIAEAAEDGVTNKDLVDGLLSYLEGRSTLEAQYLNSSKITRDERNVVKICEILYSLSFVKAGLANTGAYISNLSATLLACQIDGKGWSYFVEKSKTIKMLPTSFAVMSLHSTGHNVSAPLNFLEDVLKNELKKPINDPTQFAKYVFTLYVLVYSKNILKSVDEKRFKAYFNKLINSRVCNLSENLEQNVEYWPETDDAEHDYIRIPWQLYLIAIAAKISPWHFSKISTQELLQTIEIRTLNGGFKYPHSGPRLSTRTQSILYDVLSKIKNQLHKRLLYSAFNFIDKVISVFRTKFFRYCLLGLVALIFVYSLYKWMSKGYENFMADLGPEIAAPILFGIYFLTRNSKK